MATTTDYDEYLFISCAAPNSVNMSAGRKDSRVDKMLQLRDSGQTPSVCSNMSTASRQTASSFQSPHEGGGTPAASSARATEAALNTVNEYDEDGEEEDEGDGDGDGNFQRTVSVSRDRKQQRNAAAPKREGTRKKDADETTSRFHEEDDVHGGDYVDADADTDADADADADVGFKGYGDTASASKSWASAGRGRVKPGRDTRALERRGRESEEENGDYNGHVYDGEEDHVGTTEDYHGGARDTAARTYPYNSEFNDQKRFEQQEDRYDDAEEDGQFDDYDDAPRIPIINTRKMKPQGNNKQRAGQYIDSAENQSWQSKQSGRSSEGKHRHQQPSTEHSQWTTPRKQETAYERTYREMMAPIPPPKPVLAKHERPQSPVFSQQQQKGPVHPHKVSRKGGRRKETGDSAFSARSVSPDEDVPPRRVLSVQSVSSGSFSNSDASAVESSVSHPNHSKIRRQRHGSRVHNDSSSERHKHRGERSRHTRQRAADERSHGYRNSGGRRRASNDSRLAEIERENKMELLIELEKLQAMGVMLSFSLSMEEPEWKLKHELERHLAHQTLVQRVTLIKGMLKIGSIVIRILCSSFLGLDGWDAFIAKELDSGKYDTSLEQVYRQLFRKGTPNPWFSLGLLVIGSAIAFHVGSIMSNGQPAAGNSSGASGVIGGILTSLFGAGAAPAAAPAGNAQAPAPSGIASVFSGGLPMSIISNVLRSAGGGAPARVSVPPPPPPPPLRPAVTPPPLAAPPAAVTETRDTPRVRPRISPPLL